MSEITADNILTGMRPLTLEQSQHARDLVAEFSRLRNREASSPEVIRAQAYADTLGAIAVAVGPEVRRNSELLEKRITHVIGPEIRLSQQIDASA